MEQDLRKNDKKNRCQNYHTFFFKIGIIKKILGKFTLSYLANLPQNQKHAILF